jgi:methionyl-tRNA formyltransferase
MLNTVFMGTPAIAVPALRRLAALTRVSCVITQPDRPAGRGHRLTPPAVKVAALELGLSVWQPETLKGQGADPRLACALAVVMAYGELLRQDVLDRPAHGCVNLHGSLLPRWRGASPLQAAIRAGDPVTGVTVMRMVRGLDAGPMYLTETVPITGATTLATLHDQMAEVAAVALERFLTAWPPREPSPQDEAHVTHCRKLTLDDGRLDPAATASELDRWVRAYATAPGCWLPWQGERMRIHALGVVDRHDLAPGRLQAEQRRLFLGCADGAVELLRLQSPSKPVMDAADWLNGNRVPEVVG